MSALSPAATAKTSISSANRSATSSARTSGVRRVMSATAPSGIATRSIGWIRREPPMSNPGSTIAVSSVPTACRNVSIPTPSPSPARPTSDASGVTIAIGRPAASTIPAAAIAAPMRRG